MDDAQSQVIELLRSLPVDRRLATNGLFASPPQKINVFQRRLDREAQPVKQPNIHELYVLCFCFEAAAQFNIEDRVYRLAPGQGIVVFPNQSHYFLHFDEPEIHWLFVSFEMRDAETLNILRHRPFTIPERGMEFLAQIIREYTLWRKEHRMGSDLVAWVTLLLGELMLQAMKDRSNTHDWQAGQPPLQIERIQRVAEYVHRHLDRQIHIRDLARHICVSESHLRKLFREHLKLSVGEFVRRTRINKACGLLRTSQLNISQVAEICGFSSVYAFSRTFRQQTGLAPSRFRNEARGETTDENLS